MQLVRRGKIQFFCNITEIEVEYQRGERERVLPENPKKKIHMFMLEWVNLNLRKQQHVESNQVNLT